jgi:Phage Terminase
VAFVQWLPITKGRLEGTPMQLLPDQLRFIEDVYSREGDDRVRIAVKSEPRGNGKTGLAAALALCHMLGPEAEPRGEVYSAAIDRQQAALLFNEIEAIIVAVPEFAARVNIIRRFKKIEVTDGAGRGTIYEALSADARRAHGLAPSFFVYDELAQARDRTLLDNLRTPIGKRKALLGMVISTQAADDDHPLSLLIDDGLASGDTAVVVHLLAAPPDADPFDIETIRAVNPALGVFLDESDLVREAEMARRLPAFLPAFENLRLNRRIDAEPERRIVTREVWEACGLPVEVEALRGRPCYGALDLSGKHDLTSLTLVLPDDQPEPAFYVLPFFWTPAEATERRNPTGEGAVRPVDTGRSHHGYPRPDDPVPDGGGRAGAAEGALRHPGDCLRPLADRRLQGRHGRRGSGAAAGGIRSGVPGSVAGDRVLRRAGVDRPAAPRRPPGADGLHRERGHGHRSGREHEGRQGPEQPAGHDAHRRGRDASYGAGTGQAVRGRAGVRRHVDGCLR